MKKTLAAAVLAATLATGISFGDSAIAATSTCTSGGATTVSPTSAVGLRASGELVCFALTGSPQPSSLGTVSGLVGDTSLVGIDFRVQDGLLYGVGNAGGLYTVDTAAVATKVDQLDIALSGTLFGVDFNPAANALRIVSNTGQNLRHPFTTMITAADATLNDGASPTPAAVNGIVGAAYTNNDLNTATATTLFDLNSTGTGSIAVQSTANSGVVVNTGTFVPDATDGDLDVYTTSTGRNVAYALLVTPTGTRVHSVDLLSGQVDGGRKATGVVDIALPINQ